MCEKCVGPANTEEIPGRRLPETFCCVALPDTFAALSRMGAWLFLTLFAGVLICVVPLVQAAQPGGASVASLSLLLTAAAVSAAAAAAHGPAALLASRQRRDRDCGDAKGAKTITGYVSAFRNFYKFCRTTGRSNLVPAQIAKEKLSNPGIFDNCSHQLIAEEESDIFSCFIAWLGTNVDGSTSSASRQQSGRSAIVHYLKTRTPSRKLSVEADSLIDSAIKGHLRHIVEAKQQGLMRVSVRLWG